MTSSQRAAAAAAVLAAAFVVSGPLGAQELSIDLGGEDGSLSLRTIQIFILITLLSLAPGLAIMLTPFPFMVTVFSILRQAIGVQQAPPNMMIVSLALFLTYFVMEPVFAGAWAQGVQPMLDGTLDPEEAFQPVMDPFRAFMQARVSPRTIEMMLEAAPQVPENGADLPLSILVPSFLLSEIQRGFEVGFLIFLPFLVIDLVIAAVLMSMGMMMVPPAIVSLPFKLAFFVIADGWTLLAGVMVRSYAP
ncbi:flagellar type III secretion system pore protein FliP [soil metagenome]